MKTLAIVAGLFFLVGCSKPRHCIQTPDGLVVSANLKKVQRILDSGRYSRHEVFRTRTDGGAKRAFLRRYGNQGSFINWTVGGGLDQSRLSTKDTRRAAEHLEDRRRANNGAETVRAERQRPPDRDAEALVAAIQESLEKARWRRDELDRFLERAARLDERSAAALKARLHLVLGLFAWYVDAEEIARAEFAKAKRFGVTDYKSAVPRLWTPSSIAAFNTVTQ